MSDAERPLMEKGIERSQRIIGFLKERSILPDLFISSPAIRAYETAKLFATGLGYSQEKIRIEQKIYDGYYDKILDVIYGTNNDVGSLMIFGHNPTITNLANLFLHPGIDDMATSTVVGIGFEILKWEEVPASVSRQLFIVSPKMLR